MIQDGIDMVFMTVQEFSLLSSGGKDDNWRQAPLATPSLLLCEY